jgi:hypothetical protein
MASQQQTSLSSRSNQKKFESYFVKSLIKYERWQLHSKNHKQQVKSQSGTNKNTKTAHKTNDNGTVNQLSQSMASMRHFPAN